MRRKIISTKNAFSLIELSIVILVIGILIAGITQATSLVGKFRLSMARNVTKGGPVAGITDLVAWWETTSQSSISDSQASEGSMVSSWNDISPQSSKSRSASQSSDSYKPLYRQSIINGLPALEFIRASDVAGSYLAYPYDSALNPSEITIFAVMKTKTIPAYSAVVSSRNNLTAGSYSGYVIYASSTNNYEWWLHSGSSYGNNSPLNTPVVFDSATVITVTYGSGKAKMYDKGVSVGSAQTRPYTPSTTSDFRIGMGSSGNGSSTAPIVFPYDGYIGEIIVYSRELKTDERQEVEKYLGKKWGIKIS